MGNLRRPGMSKGGAVPRLVAGIFSVSFLLSALFVIDFGNPRLFSGSAPAVAAETPTDSKRLLDELVRKAKQEGQLTASITSTWSKTIIQPLADAFKKRFGLDIRVTIANVNSARHFPVAIAETQARASATYDVVQGTDSETMQIVGAGATQRIENWAALLAEVNPVVRSGKVLPRVISSGPLEGHAFMYMANVKQIVYNTRLITEKELPRTHRELADPRFKGMFTQPPWTTHWDPGPAAFDKVDRNEWLDVVRRAGRNTAAVLSETAAVQRVVLGEFAFSLNQDRHFRGVMTKDPKAPIAYRFFDDYNGLTGFYYSVRTGARSPAAATLFALWMTTAEAQAIWQPSDLQATPYGESQIDRDFREMIEKAGARVISFFDNEKTLELLNWYRTEEGRKYLDAMARGIRGE